MIGGSTPSSNMPRNVARLSRTFSQSLTVADLMEPLLSLDENQPVAMALELMRGRRLSVLGVRREGSVAGWVKESDLVIPGAGSASLGDRARALPREGETQLQEHAGLDTVLTALTNADCVFITWLDEVAGVVTREDLQKAPLRMWLFGAITILDLNMTWAIEQIHPEDSWRGLVSPGRLGKAQVLHEARQRCGSDCRLVDCLQIKDKADILMHDRKHLEVLGLSSRRQAGRFAASIESLRNHLAHSQDLEDEHLLTAARLATFIESIVRAEGVRRMVETGGSGKVGDTQSPADLELDSDTP